MELHTLLEGFVVLNENEDTSNPLEINRFWLDWKTTNQEFRAIQSINKAIDFLFSHIQKERIVAIYIKGSFVRRELIEKSDVDIVPITKDNETVAKIRELQEKNASEYSPSELRPLSIQELKAGKRSDGNPGNPIDLLERRDKCMLIWGDELNPDYFPVRRIKERAIAYENAFPEHFFPFFEKGKYAQKELAKASFWLIDTRFRVQGKKPPLRWQDMLSLLPKDHFGHKAWDVRMGKEVPEFYEKLKEYWREKKL